MLDSGTFRSVTVSAFFNFGSYKWLSSSATPFLDNQTHLMYVSILNKIEILSLFITLCNIYIYQETTVPGVKYQPFIPPLSPIGRIKILTYLIWGFLGAAIFDCIIRSCDLFYWFIRTCLGPTVVPAAITSLELFCILTMCYFSDNLSS